ncbi:PGF-pre-PGF domain-containing protein [Candidatus Woesearchaeota archaeon]|nr:PGF-pre-PGF domain-containing protein [Candidatus Woesearchaeota archaeon]
MTKRGVIVSGRKTSSKNVFFRQYSLYLIGLPVALVVGVLLGLLLVFVTQQFTGLSVYDDALYSGAGYDLSATLQSITASSSRFSSTDGTIISNGVNSVFIYNSSNDGLSNSWRSNTSLSWYNEFDSALVRQYLILNNSRVDYVYVNAGSVNATDLEPGLGDMSWTGWFYLNSSLSTVGYFSKMGNAVPGAGYGLYSTKNATIETFNFSLRHNDSFVVELLANASLNMNAWRHIGVVLNHSGNASIYINGSLIGSVNVSAIYNKNVSPGSGYNFILGRANTRDSGNHNFTYGIDEFRIYTRALSSSEVLDDYNTGFLKTSTNVSGNGKTFELTFDSGIKTDTSTKNHTSGVATNANAFTNRRDDTRIFPARSYCITDNSGWNIINASNGRLWMGMTEGEGYYDSTSTNDCFMRNGKLIYWSSGGGVNGLFIVDFTADQIKHWDTSGLRTFNSNISRRNFRDGFSSYSGYALGGNPADISCINLTSDIVCAIGHSTGIDIVNISGTSYAYLANSSIGSSVSNVYLSKDKNLYYIVSGGGSSLFVKNNVTSAGVNFTKDSNISLGGGSVTSLHAFNNKIFLAIESNGVRVYNSSLSNIANYTLTNGVLSSQNSVNSMKGIGSDVLVVAERSGMNDFGSITEINTSSNSRIVTIARLAQPYESISGSGAHYSFENVSTDQINGDNNITGARNYSSSSSKIGSYSLRTSGSSGSWSNITGGSDTNLSNSNWTVELFVNPDSGGGPSINKTLLYASSGSSYYWFYLDTSSNVAFSWSNGSATESVPSTATVSSNTWSHIAYVKSGSQLRVYVNGNLNSIDADGTYTAIINITSVSIGSDWSVGGRSDDGSNLTGYVDELRIIKTALSGSNISEDYAKTLPVSSTRLEAYASFSVIDVEAPGAFNVSGTSGTYLLGSDSGANSFGSSLSWTSTAGDSTPPAVTINSPSSGSNHTLNFVINATVTDSQNTVSSVQYRYENSSINSSWTSMSQSGTYWTATVNISTITDGNYTFRINASDNAENYNTTVTINSVTVDDSPPAISGVANSSVTSSSFIVSWNVSKSSNGSVNYGTNSSNLSSSATNSSLRSNHTISISSLSASTVYYYNITSCDALANCNTTGFYNVTTSAASSDSSSSSGGGGGSVSNTSSPFNPLKQTVAYSVKKDVPAIMKVSRADIPITEVELTLLSDKSTAKVTIEKLASRPSTTLEFSGSTIAFLSIEKSGFENSDVSSSKLSFEIPRIDLVAKSIAPENVALYRFTTQWDELETSFEGLNGSVYRYKALTNGFSYFIIASKSSPVIAEEIVDTLPESEPVVETVILTNDNAGNIAGAATGISDTGRIAGIAIAVLLIVAIIGLYFMRKK